MARSAVLLGVPLVVAVVVVFVVRPLAGEDDPDSATLSAPLVDRLGGITTTFRQGPGVFATVARGLTADELRQFARGREVFERVWDDAGTGGSPISARTCSSCHPGRGRSIDARGRNSPHLVGLGLLEAIPVERLEALADPDDADGDGVSGRVGAGRFGWQATQPTIRDQVLTALTTDFGVDVDEVATEDLDDLVFYTRLLAVPARRRGDEPVVRNGAELFETVGCATCHTPSHETARVDVAALSGQEIWPYSDLLLHDLGDGEYRTPPLWSFGRHADVSGGLTLLHDGRVDTVEGAVDAHAGEAASARQAWRDLAPGDREALVAFLLSL